MTEEMWKTTTPLAEKYRKKLLTDIYNEVVKCRNKKGKFPSVNNRKDQTVSGKRPKSIFFGKRPNTRATRNLYPNEPNYRGNLYYPKVYKLLTEYHDKFHKDHKYTVILVNRSVQFLKHKDKGNVEGSVNLIVGTGNYTGGELTLFDEEDIYNYPKTIDIRYKPLFFNPFQYHQVEPFEGDRVTITYYST
tara:strand:- start:143 stop:712 length:570 start_codon:yes stop_codon:yes gene_type:complete